MEIYLGTSPQAILSGSKNNEFSLATDLLPSDAEALLHSSSSTVKHQDIPGLNTYYIVLNIHRGPFTDEATRQRFIEAVDVDPMIRRVLGRLAVPAVSLTPPSLLGHQPARRAITRSKKHQNTVEITAMIHSIYEGQYAFFKNELFKILNEAGFRIKIVDTKAEFYAPEGIPITDITFTRWLADYPDADTFLYGLLHSEKGWKENSAATRR